MAPISRPVSMRLFACLALMGGLALSSCADGDDLQGPGSAAGILRVSPQLTFEGVGLSDPTDESLGLAWDDRDAWEVVVTANPDGRTAADTIIDVDASNEVDTLEVVIDTRVSDRSYDFHFTALDADGQPLFTSTMEGVTVTDGDLLEIEGTLAYVGPGADASAVLLVPRAVVVMPGLSAGLLATVVDAEGDPIEDVPLGWASDDPAIAEVSSCDGCDAPDVDAEGGVEGIDVDSRVNATADASGALEVGVTISGFDPEDVLRVTPDLDGRFVAWSPWGRPDFEEGQSSGSVYHFRVMMDEDPERVGSFGAGGGPFDGYEAARDAFMEQFPAGVELTGASSYTFWIGDSPVTDNSGGVSLRVAEIVPAEPNGVVRTFAEGRTIVRVSTPTGLTAETEVVVTGSLEIFPTEAERLPGGTQQFTVSELPPGTALVWTVNGVEGGDEVFGTITGDGFYTAPEEVPDPDRFPICVHIEGAPTTEACATMTISPIPTAGEDLVVINDMNIFDNGAMTAGVGDPNNHIMVRNLVGFTGDRTRSDETVILWDRGRNSPCANNGECLDDNMSTTRSVIEEAGFTIRSIESEEGSLTEIEPDVKMIWLWNPTVPFTVEEVNTLKRFAGEGGRILFVGEHAGFFGSSGITTENQLLADMGAEMVNVGNAVECGFNDLPAHVLREHQITEGMEAVRMACASVIEPGPNDFVLFTDRTETHVLAGVAKIDVTPISEHAPLPSVQIDAPIFGESSAAGAEMTGGR